MYECEWCGATYQSEFAAAECEEADRLEDLHTRQITKGRR